MKCHGHEPKNVRCFFKVSPLFAANASLGVDGARACLWPIIAPFLLPPPPRSKFRRVAAADDGGDDDDESTRGKYTLHLSSAVEGQRGKEAKGEWKQ